MIMKQTLAVAAISAMTLSACTSTDTPTDDPNRRTKEGVATGALLGAVTGALVGGNDRGERTRGALIGAAVGSVAGGVIGNNLDKQAAELQAELGSGRIQIINNGDHLVVRMPDDILFDVDSADVKPSLRSDLGLLANNLQRYPDSTIQIVGHTDSTGTPAYNQGLSQRRAGAVSAELIGKGVSAGRIQSFGVGETQPIADNSTAVGKAANRRVDITIRPNA